MKKNIFKKLAFCVLAASLSSCSSYFYQVYTVDSNLQHKENSLVFENEDCKVLYNLWSSNGEVKFAIVNKTDKDIFINMGQTFFTVNGQAREYFQDRTYTTQRYSETNFGYGSANGRVNGNAFWGNGIYMENTEAIFSARNSKYTNATLSGVTEKEKEIVCIPAKSFKVFNYYKVNPSWIKVCDRTKDFPTGKYIVGSYSKSDTPMIFNNRIAYGFSKSEVAEKYIDNEFWISGVCNFSRNAATESVKEKGDCYDTWTSKFRRFKIGGPDMFYKVLKSDGKGWIVGR